MDLDIANEGVLWQDWHYSCEVFSLCSSSGVRASVQILVHTSTLDSLLPLWKYLLGVLFVCFGVVFFVFLSLEVPYHQIWLKKTLPVVTAILYTVLQLDFWSDTWFRCIPSFLPCFLPWWLQLCHVNWHIKLSIFLLKLHLGHERNIRTSFARSSMIWIIQLKQAILRWCIIVSANLYLCILRVWS